MWACTDVDGGDPNRAFTDTCTAADNKIAISLEYDKFSVSCDGETVAEYYYEEFEGVGCRNMWQSNFTAFTFYADTASSQYRLTQDSEEGTDLDRRSKTVLGVQL